MVLSQGTLDWESSTLTTRQLFHASTNTNFHNILELFDILPNFPFITSDAMRDYYLQTWSIQVGSRVIERLNTWEMSGNV